MHLLFSFLKPDHSHSTLLAGYFSKVLVYLHNISSEIFVPWIAEFNLIEYNIFFLGGLGGGGLYFCSDTFS